MEDSCFCLELYLAYIKTMEIGLKSCSNVLAYVSSAQYPEGKIETTIPVKNNQRYSYNEESQSRGASVYFVEMCYRVWQSRRVHYVEICDRKAVELQFIIQKCVVVEWCSCGVHYAVELICCVFVLPCIKIISLLLAIFMSLF